MKRLQPLLLIVLFADFAEAKCRVSGPKWYLHTNDRVDLTVTSDSQGCGHYLGARFAWRMDKIEIMKTPDNGTIRQLGDSTFYYIPKRDYIGQDNYVFYICGKDTWGLGCSRLNFKVTVNRN